MRKIALVIQGGTLRTIFTAGVLDGFMSLRFFPFQYMVGVSGGAMCLAYYVSRQRKCAYDIFQHIFDDEKFINWKNMFSEQGMINLEYLVQYAKSRHHINMRKFRRFSTNRLVEIVTTSYYTGKPIYIVPNTTNLFVVIKASATLPFLTKGVQVVDDRIKLLDGGWSDPIPVKRAIKLGYKEIVVIRTYPKEHRENWTYMNKFGSYWHKNNPELSKTFDSDHIKYNEIANFLETDLYPIKIHQIIPENYLETTSYSTSQKKLQNDYRHGFELGVEMALKLKRNIFRKKIE